MSEANKAHAAILRQMADVYEASEAEIRPLNLTIHADTREQVATALKAIGGKFEKEVPNGSVDSFMYIRSKRLPGVSVVIWRDAVCEKVVTYNCKPLLSPEEEAELLEVANA